MNTKLLLKPSQIFRDAKNKHRFFYYLNGKLRTFTTHVDDINHMIAELFGMLNAAYATPAASVKMAMLATMAGVSLLTSQSMALDSNALPTGFQSVSGNHVFSQTGNVLQVSTGAQQSIVNYNTFDVGSAATVKFNLPGSNSTILNRVLSGQMSQIYGSIQSNGNVFLINPAGVLFGQGAAISVSGLVASTLDIANHKFLSGQYEFSRAVGSGLGQIKIEDGANINIANGGSASFLASSFVNSGNVTAGRIQIAVGDRIQLGSDLIGFTIDEAVQDQLDQATTLITNNGTLSAEAVKIMAAALKESVLDVIVNNSGRIIANKVVDGAGGTVELIADGSGIIKNTGLVDASGTTGGSIHVEGQAALNEGGQLLAAGTEGDGGAINFLGQFVAMTDGAVVDASGQTGGGSINVGGSYMGQDPNIKNSDFTYVGEGVTLKADAIDSGNGGQVVLWSDGDTIFQGSISAKGGATSGDGGLVEVSGKENLLFQGLVDTTAANGALGSLLLDPTNLTIDNSGSTNIPTCVLGPGCNANQQNSLRFTRLADFSYSGDYIVGAGFLNAANADTTLSATNNITFTNNTVGISLSGKSFTAQAGQNIIVNDNLGTFLTAKTITLRAGNNLTLGQGSTIATAGSGTKTVDLTAGYRFKSGSTTLYGSAQPGTLTIDGSISNASGTVNLDSRGAITQGGTGLISAETLNINSSDLNNSGGVAPAIPRGNITLGNIDADNLSVINSGAGNSTTITDIDGITVTGANVGSGNLTINAGASAVSHGNGGIFITGDMTGGNVSLNVQNGTGGIVASGFTVDINATDLTMITQGGAIYTPNIDANTLTVSTVNGSASGNITVYDDDGLIVNSANAGTSDIEIKAANAINSAIHKNESLTIAGNVIGKDVALEIENGSGQINQTGGQISADKLSLFSETGSITLNNVDTNSLYINTDNANVTVSDVDNVTLIGASLGSGNLTLNAGASAVDHNNGGIAITGNVTSNNVTLAVQNGTGNITQTAGDIVSSSLGLNTNGGNVTANNVDTDTLTVNTNGGNATVTDKDGLTVGDSALGAGNLTINAHGTATADNGNAESGITLDGNIQANNATFDIKSTTGGVSQASGDLEVTSNLNVQTRGGAVSITNMDASTLTLRTNNGVAAGANATITDRDGLTINSANVGTGGTLTVTAGNGNAADNGVAESGLTLAGDVNGLNVNLNVVDSGSGITQTAGRLTATTLSMDTNEGAITTNNVDTRFLNIDTTNAGSGGANATFGDRDGLTINSANVGTGTLTVNAYRSGVTANNSNGESGITLAGNVNGATVNLSNNVSLAGTGAVINQTAGALTATNLTLNTNGGAITLNNIDVANVTANTTNGLGLLGANITLTDSDGLTTGTINAGLGTVTINAHGGNAANNGASELGLTLNGNLNALTTNLNVLNTTEGISQSGGELETVTLNLSTNGGSISLNNVDTTNLSVLTNNGSATIGDRDGLRVTNANVGTGILTINAFNGSTANNGVSLLEGNLTLAGNVNGQTVNLNVNSGAGNIVQSSGNLTATDLNFSTTGGNVTANNVDTETLTVNTSGGNATVTDTDGVKVGNSNVGTGTLTINAQSTTATADNGNTENNLSIIGDVAGQTVNLNVLSGTFDIDEPGSSVVATNLNLTTTGGDIDLHNVDTTNLTIDTTVGGAAGGNASVVDKDGLTITSAEVGAGTLSVTAGHGANTADNGNAESGITLDGNVNGATVNLTVEDSGDIDQVIGDLTASDLNFNTNGGNVTALNVDTTTLSLTTNGGHVTLNDKDGLTLETDANLGSGNLTITTFEPSVTADNGNAEGDLVVDTQVDANNVELTAREGDINLNANINSTAHVDIVTLGTDGDITQQAGTTVSGTLSVDYLTYSTDSDIILNGSTTSDNNIDVVTLGADSEIIASATSNLEADTVELTTIGANSGITLGGSIQGHSDVEVTTISSNSAITLESTSDINAGSLTTDGEVTMLTIGNNSGISQADGASITADDGISFTTIGSDSTIDLNGTVTATDSGVSLTTIGSGSTIQTGATNTITADTGVNLLTIGSNASITLNGDITNNGNSVNITTVGSDAPVTLGSTANITSDGSFAIITLGTGSTINQVAGSSVEANGPVSFNTVGNNSGITLGGSNESTTGSILVQTAGSLSDILLSDGSTVQGATTATVKTLNDSNITLAGLLQGDTSVDVTIQGSTGLLTLAPTTTINSNLLTGRVALKSDNMLFLGGSINSDFLSYAAFNPTTTIGVGGGTGVLQLPQLAFDIANVNDLFIGDQFTNTTITIGRVVLTGNPLDLTFNTLFSVQESTPFSDSGAAFENVVMNAGNDIYFTGGATSAADRLTAPGVQFVGNNLSPFGDIDVALPGDSLAYVKLPDAIGVGKVILLITPGGAAFVNVPDDDDSGKLRNLAGSLGSRIATQIQNEFKGNTINLPGGPFSFLGQGGLGGNGNGASFIPFRNF